MVASCYHPSEKNKAQGFNDAILFSCVALSSLASGQVLNDFGWNTLTLIFWPVVLICLLLLAFDHLRRRGDGRAQRQEELLALALALRLLLVV